MPIVCIEQPSEFDGLRALAHTDAPVSLDPVTPRSPLWSDEMAVPKRKTSRMKRGFRRSADGLAAPTYIEDKDTGELRRPHHVDLKSGMYRGRQVLEAKDE